MSAGGPRRARPPWRRTAIAVAVACWVAAFGAYALAHLVKHQQGTAVAIAIPAGVVFLLAVAWLGRGQQ